MMQVDGGLKQHPHGAYPSGMPAPINYPLQITQVMRQTELMRLAGGFICAAIVSLPQTSTGCVSLKTLAITARPPASAHSSYAARGGNTR
jgi:hypothetical protein